MEEIRVMQNHSRNKKNNIERQNDMIDDTDNNLLDGRVMPNHSRNRNNNIERQNAIDNDNYGVNLPNDVLPNVENLSRNVNRNNITRQNDN